MVRELVNVSEGARRSGVPRTTVASWIRGQKLFPAGLDAEGTPLYDLATVRRLAKQTPRRRRRSVAAS